MRPRSALVLALVLAGAAIALVTADLAWSLHARVEASSDGGWTTVADTRDEAGGVYRTSEECVVAGQEMRITFDNDKPLPDTVEIRVRYYNESNGREQTVFEDTWSLSAFGSRSETLTVPTDALQSRSGPEMASGGHLNIEFDRSRAGHYERGLGVCVQEAS